MFEPKEVKRLSISDISLGFKCRAALWFKLHLGPLPPSGAMVIGNAFHKGTEVALKEVAKCGKLPPISVVTDAYNDQFKVEILEAALEDGEKPSDIENDGLETIKAYYDKQLPLFEPACEEDVEYPFKLEVEPDKVVTGRIDLILPSKIVDHKTTGSYNLTTATKGIQKWGYQLPFKSPKAFAYSVICLKNQKTSLFDLQITKYQMEAFKNSIRALFRTLELGLIEPAPDAIICSPTSCGYWKHCPFGGRQED